MLLLLRRDLRFEAAQLGLEKRDLGRGRRIGQHFGGAEHQEEASRRASREKMSSATHGRTLIPRLVDVSMLEIRHDGSMKSTGRVGEMRT
jgi:hypothetical protein